MASDADRPIDGDAHGAPASEPPVEDERYDRQVRRQLGRTGRAIVKGAKNTPVVAQEQFTQWIDRSIDKTLERELDDWRNYVDKLREQNPQLSNEDLARLIVQRRSLKNGALGAATSVGGVLVMPVAIPADVVGSFMIQIRTALAVACVFGHTQETADLKTDIYLILAGEAASQALKRAGIEVGKHVTRKAIQKHITREVMTRIWRIIPQRILTKAGEKSATSFMRLVPVVGAPIGFGVDYATSRAIGATAVRYYSGQA